MVSSKLEQLTQTFTIQNYIILPPYFTRKTIYISCLLIFAASATLFAVWPSRPDVTIARLRLLHVTVQTHPRIAVDVSLAANVRVRNRNLYSIDYTRLLVAVGYRGKVLGHVSSGGGHVMARGSSYVDATVELYGVEVITDLVYLLEDLRKGFLRFETLTQVDGFIGLLFLEIPLTAKISCEIDVNIKHQTVTHQNCYPEA